MRHALILIGLFAPCLLRGEQPAQPLPDGTLLERAPEFSKWVVTYNPEKPGQEKDRPQAAAPGQAAISKITVTKANNIYHEEVEDASGAKRDSWRIGDMLIMTTPGSKQRRILDSSSFGPGGPDPLLYTDYSKTDFPGLEWISAKYYAGIKNAMGVDYIMFRRGPSSNHAEKGRKLTPDEVPATPSGTGDTQSEMIAYVDLATRLPAFFQAGDEVRVYRFVPLPSGTQPIPTELQETLDQRFRQLEEMTRRPPRPY